jgi:putative Ca2+/H+ antiporter (TMEM165/GDT1 family)/putative Mn2+ efflux pump MntP
MTSLVASLLFVTLAEMGDKTQLLAMAFATRFPARIVLAAVFVATILNHALAVAAGRLLTTLIPLEVISFTAALSFILFGLWTIRGDTLEGEDAERAGYGPFLTVAIAFFLAEIGDKTQLATISLAVKYPDPLAVLMGTTAGMVVADGLGILVGIVLGKRLPEGLIRLASAGIFIAFGFVGAGAILSEWMSLAASAALLFALALGTLAAAHYYFLQRRRQDAQPATGRPPQGSLDRLTQSYFVGLLLIGWIASLGLARPLAAVDHWVAFALLCGLGWRLIHGAVRADHPALRLDARLCSAILLLAALTSAQAFLTGFPLSLALAPVAVLLLAVALLLAGPALARGPEAGRTRRIGRHRIEIAGGLVLIGIALKTLLAHLA